MGQTRPRGKRYSNDSKLNYGKILAVIIAIAVIIMFGMAIKYLLAYDFTKNSGKKEYFPLYSENKWGVINSYGETVIAPSYAEMIVIPDNTQDVFLCVYEVETETGTYKTKALDSTNKELFVEYDQVEALENYDKSQNVWYEENVLKVRNGEKYGLINLNGKLILNCEYDDIYTLKGIKNSLITKKGEQLGLVDTSGRIVLDNVYSEILPLGKNDIDGYITKNEQGKYGVLGTSGEQKLENKYEKIEQIVGNNLFVITQEGKQKLINSKGTIVLENTFDEITQILKDSKGIVFKKDRLYGLMTIEGTVIIPNIYEDLKQLDNGYIVAKKDARYGIIDNSNNEKLYFNYNYITYNKDLNIYIAEDIDFKSSIIDENFEVKIIGILSEVNSNLKYIKMHINGEYKYYDLNFEEKTNLEILKGNTLFLSKKEEKYGYIDSEGNVVVDYIYDDATEQNKFGYVAVQKNGKWGALDREGQEVVKPIYSLDNNIIIDFIGKWHLGEDINMNYYCEK